MRYSGTAALALLTGLGVGVDASQGQTEPSFEVTTSLLTPLTVPVGGTFEITVSAEVTNPASPDDGIALFDQNFVVDQATSGLPSPFEILSIVRPGVDDASYGGSDGTDTYDPSTGDYLGRTGIYGGYDAFTVGVGAPATLYEVELEAVSAGAATFTSGPSLDGYGPASPGEPTPDGIYLNDGTTPEGTYLLGPTVTAVSAIPEPASATLILSLMGTTVLIRRRGELPSTSKLGR